MGDRGSPGVQLLLGFHSFHRRSAARTRFQYGKLLPRPLRAFLRSAILLASAFSGEPLAENVSICEKTRSRRNAALMEGSTAGSYLLNINLTAYVALIEGDVAGSCLLLAAAYASIEFDEEASSSPSSPASVLLVPPAFFFKYLWSVACFCVFARFFMLQYQRIVASNFGRSF